MENLRTIYNIRSVGDKYYDKGKTGEKESYWNVGVGKPAILGGQKSGQSMDVTFRTY